MSVRHERQMRGTIRILQHTLKSGRCTHEEEMELIRRLAELEKILAGAERLRTKHWNAKHPVRTKRAGPIVPETFN